MAIVRGDLRSIALSCYNSDYYGKYITNLRQFNSNTAGVSYKIQTICQDKGKKSK
jgi:hypothetical protein